MKPTPLTQKHIALGAKMVPFAGYNMPVQYSGVNEEHLDVRSSVGVFDVSHMGEFFLEGEKALDLIQLVTSNDASQLYDGRVQYSCLPNDTGGIVDDLLVYRMDSHHYLLVVNASNIEKDWNWIASHNTFGVQLKNYSDAVSLFAVQGPKAIETLQKLTAVNLSEIKYYHFVKGVFAGVPEVIISNTGYTGAGGFEVYFENKHAEKIWDAIFLSGKEYGIKPIGLAARDTLRLEMGFCLYGNDIDDTTSPLEAGLGWVTKFNKDFISKELLLKQKAEGIKRKLVGFEMVDKGIARHDYKIIDKSENDIGRVTSGTMAPSLKKAIGMGYVDSAFAAPGSEIYILVRDKALLAKVVKMPFFVK